MVVVVVVVIDDRNLDVVARRLDVAVVVVIELTTLELDVIKRVDVDRNRGVLVRELVEAIVVVWELDTEVVELAMTSWNARMDARMKDPDSVS